MKNDIFLKFIIILFFSIQLWFVFICTQYPVIGADVKKDQAGSWVVSTINQRNTAIEAGLQKGDIIKLINGNNPNQFVSLIKWRTLDQALNVLIIRNGTEVNISLKSDHNFSDYDVLAVTIGSICLLCSVLLMQIKKNSTSAKYLMLVLLDMGGIFMSLGASIRGDALGKMSILLLVMLVPILFLHFFLVFLKEKQNYRLSIAYLKRMYTVSIMGIALVSQLTYFFAATITYHVYTFNTIFSILCFIFGLLLSFYILSKLFFKYRNERTYMSTMIRTVWVSLFISFSPVVCFSLLPTLISGSAWINSLYSSIFVFFFPMTLAYLVVTTKLYDFDLVLRRVILTALIALLPSGLFVVIVKIMFPAEDTFERILIMFVLFVAILTYVLYSLENVFTKLEPIMFPRKYYLQSALKNIAKNLGSITSFRELKDIILVDIVNTLQINGGAIVFKYNQSIEVISQGAIDTSEIESYLNSEKSYHDSFSCYEINRQQEYTTYFIITGRKTRTFLGSEEKQWLSLILTYLAVSLENVHLIRKLTMKLQQLASQIPNEQAANDFIWFRKLMFELQEKERIRIATDLHDTTMQDLFFLKERLHSLLEKYVLTKEDYVQMISIIDYIDVINSNLRQSCFELHPYLIKEIGLVRTIEQLVGLEVSVAAFEINFKAIRANFIEMRDMETKRHIFRMVQELINNAKKHSQAYRVTIQLADYNNHIELTYIDDGVGFEPSITIAKEIGSSGMGIDQIKSRILSLNGHYDLETSKGNGMKLVVFIPMKEGLTA